MGPPVIDLLGVRAGDRNVLIMDLTSDGVPWDLTGAVLSAHARQAKSDPTPALEAVVQAVDESTGKYRLSWDGEEVRTVLGTAENWSGVWDLQVVEAGQILAETVAEGKLTCELDVTRP